jgi:hypothetical protein
LKDRLDYSKEILQEDSGHRESLQKHHYVSKHAFLP